MPRTSIASTAAAGSSRNRGVLMLAAVFGILSAALMFAFLNSRGAKDSTLDQALNAGNGAESVLVFTRDVGAGEKITDSMLEAKTVPAAALLPGRFEATRSQELVGKVTTAPAVTGEQVLSAKVTTYEGQAGLAYKIPEGMRALALQVPHEAWIAGGLPQPGDRVDVLGLTTLSKIDPLTGAEKPDVIAGILASDVEVLAVSQTLVKVVVNTDAQKAKAAASSTATAGATTTTLGTSTTTGGSGTSVDPDKEKDLTTYEKAISVTLALPVDLAAKVAIIDAMKDEVGQWRILPRQKGDAKAIEGAQLWSLEDVFTQKKK
ncbi:MAG: Flp pilus assembly protein CpaB [Dehalococcoidia bacterium]